MLVSLRKETAEETPSDRKGIENASRTIDVVCVIVFRAFGGDYYHANANMRIPILEL